LLKITEKHRYLKILAKKTEEWADAVILYFKG